MNDKIHIRIANETDVDTIVALNHKLFQEDAGQRDPFMNLDWPMEHGHGYFSSLLQEDQTHCLLAERERHAVGYLIGYMRKSSSLRPVALAELESMFVVAEARSSGVGTGLVKCFKQWSQEQGAQRMTVTAYAANARAIAFYQRHGFEFKNVTLEAPLDANQSVRLTTDSEPDIDQVFPKRVAAELAAARAAHAPMYSLHEGYAVLLEEVDELWDEIKAKVRNHEKIADETVQIAAMCQRLFEDVIQKKME